MAYVQGRETGRFAALLAFDAMATTAALFLAAALRFDGNTPPEWAHVLFDALPVLIGARLATLWLARMHRWSFYLSGLEEGLRLGAATLGGTLVFSVVWYAGLRSWLPVSIVILELFITSFFLAAVRYVPRIATTTIRERFDEGYQRTLIVGAGSAGDLLLRDLRRSPEQEDPRDRLRRRQSAQAQDDAGREADPGKHRAAARSSSRSYRRSPSSCSPSWSCPPSGSGTSSTPARPHKAKFKIIPASFTQMRPAAPAAILQELQPQYPLPAARSVEAGEAPRPRGAAASGDAPPAPSAARSPAAPQPARTSWCWVDMNENG